MSSVKWVFDHDKKHLVNMDNIIALEVSMTTVYARMSDHTIFSMIECATESEAKQHLMNLAKGLNK